MEKFAISGIWQLYSFVYDTIILPLSLRTNGECLAVRVMGRASYDNIEMSENEWAKSCNLRGGYCLYVVFDYATPHPCLVRGQDLHSKLLARERESLVYSIPWSELLTTAEPGAGNLP